MLEQTGQEVWLLLYHHEHGVDVGAYEDNEAARAAMAQVIKNWATDEDVIRLVDQDLDAAREKFEEITDEHFTFERIMVMRRATAIDELERSVNADS